MQMLAYNCRDSARAVCSHSTLPTGGQSHNKDMECPPKLNSPFHVPRFAGNCFEEYLILSFPFWVLALSLLGYELYHTALLFLDYMSVLENKLSALRKGEKPFAARWIERVCWVKKRALERSLVWYSGNSIFLDALQSSDKCLQQ